MKTHNFGICEIIGLLAYFHGTQSLLCDVEARSLGPTRARSQQDHGRSSRDYMRTRGRLHAYAFALVLARLCSRGIQRPAIADPTPTPAAHYSTSYRLSYMLAHILRCITESPMFSGAL